VGLTADGLNVTATGLAPVIIVVPASIPTLTGTTVTRSNDQLTVVIDGFSNTREVSQAVFTFTAAAGATLSTSEVTTPVTTLFGGWFGAAESVTYGSTFKYTQIFNVSDAATNVGSVTVTLTNSAGASAAQTSQ